MARLSSGVAAKSDKTLWRHNHVHIPDKASPDRRIPFGSGQISGGDPDRFMGVAEHHIADLKFYHFLFCKKRYS